MHGWNRKYNSCAWVKPEGSPDGVWACCWGPLCVLAVTPEGSLPNLGVLGRTGMLWLGPEARTGAATA